ncbi:MAG: Gx transporter family protein [Christensenellales bacterium]|jgi:heptaprenyl diphosphate synthase
MRKSHVARLAMLTAAGLIISYLEYLIPLPIQVPGVKLGLANIATLIALYLYGTRRASAVLLARVLLSNFMFGSISAAIYALSGGFLALIVMAVFKRLGLFSPAGVSAAGGLMHNMGQLIAAAVIAKTPGLLYYLPTLAVAGVLTGALVGLLASGILKKLG